MNQMNIHERVEMRNKKNNDFLSGPCYPVNRKYISRKIQIEKEKKGRKNDKIYSK